MAAYRATVTRTDDKYIWFVFAQESREAEGFLPKGRASLEAGTEIVVDSFRNGGWYLAAIEGDSL